VASNLPRELYVEVTNRCNSHCQACVRTFDRQEPLRDMQLSEFRAIVDEFPVLNRVVLHGIGEPLLNADLVAMIRYLKDRHPTVSVLFNSNAVLLDEGWQQALIDVGLDEYRVSIDAATADTYARIRGIDAYNTVIDNVRRLARALRTLRDTCRPRLSFWLTALRENLGELPALVDIAAEIGVPEVYVQRLVLHHHGLARTEHSLYGQLRAQEEAALAEAAARAEAHGLLFRASGLTSPRESLRRQDDREEKQVKPSAACHRLWVVTYITANGNVLPCCISPFATSDYPSLILGNVFQSPFAQIWNGERYVARRAALHTAHPLHPCDLCGTQWAL
jgi:MoaA/NifB/PqqE/SkfB family radical SAM enzyme